ncbi:hypothetical protein AVEN_271302-1, partial [Araneus ventricosus]
TICDICGVGNKRDLQLMNQPFLVLVVTYESELHPSHCDDDERASRRRPS